MLTPSLAFLGQSGVSLRFGSDHILVDPYLSDSVAESFGPELRRRVPVTVQAAKMKDVTCVLITHEHLDHLDPATLAPIAVASPLCDFWAPQSCHPALLASGIAVDRIHSAPEYYVSLTPHIQVRAIPAAHPVIERDERGNLLRVGYLMKCGDFTLYHAGDTSLDVEILEALSTESRVDVAMLPVNERNFFRDRAGILGNMSIREAFGFAAEIRATRVVPLHWDMFEPNSVDPDEIRIVHERERYPHELVFLPLDKSSE